MHGGNYMNVSPRTALSDKRAKSAQYSLIDENETRLFGLRRLDQGFPSSYIHIACKPKSPSRYP